MSFLDPITISLSLITFWAYWPLSQTIEFINLFPELLDPFTSSLSLFIPMGLLLYSLGFFVSFDSSSPLSVLVDLLAINPVILAY